MSTNETVSTTNETVTVKEMVTEWSGPVFYDGKYYEDTYDAAMEFFEDRHTSGDIVPSVVAECCDTRPPFCRPDFLIDEMLETIDQEDENYIETEIFPGEVVTPEQKAELATFIQEWLSRLNWRSWHCNGKFIDLAPEINEIIVEFYGAED